MMVKVLSITPRFTEISTQGQAPALIRNCWDVEVQFEWPISGGVGQIRDRMILSGAMDTATAQLKALFWVEDLLKKFEGGR